MNCGAGLSGRRRRALSPSPSGLGFPIIFLRDFVELRFVVEAGPKSSASIMQKSGTKPATVRQEPGNSGNAIRDNGKPEPSGRGQGERSKHTLTPAYLPRWGEGRLAWIPTDRELANVEPV